MNILRLFNLKYYLLMLMPLLLVACDNSNSPAPAPTLNQILIESPADMTSGIPAGIPIQLKAVGIFSDNTTADITNAEWLSSAPNEVGVDSSGKITGLIVGGSAVISASSAGKTGTIEVRVASFNLTQITVTPVDSAPLPVGTKRLYTATGTFNDSGVIATFPINDYVEWSSTGPGILDFPASEPAGTALGITIGDVDIKATEPDSLQFDTVSVTVAAPTSTPVLAISPTQGSDDLLIIGDEFQARAILQYQTDPLDAPDVTGDVSWLSDEPSIISVSDAVGSKGRLTANAAGTVTIRASGVVSGASVSSEQSYTVSEVVGKLLSLDIAPISKLPKNIEYQLTVTASFDQGPNLPLLRVDVTYFVTYTSNNAAVVSVGNSDTNRGLLTVTEAGTAKITVAIPGTSITSILPVEVVDVAPDQIVVTPSSPANLPVGMSQQFTATATYTIDSQSASFDITKQAAFTSSQPDFAKISNAVADKGKATGVAVGATDIRANLSASASSPVPLAVTAVTIDSIAITPANTTLPRSAKNLFYTAEGTMSDASKRDVTEEVIWWLTNGSNLNVASFSQSVKGLLHTGSTAGNATINAVSDTLVETTPITVTDATATSVSINGAITVKKGELISLAALANFPAPANTIDVTLASQWSSANDGIAMVISASVLSDFGRFTGSGVVLGNSVGTTTITVDFGGQTSTHSITVTP